jgi:transcriptional regulator with XRE-family HTH domain
MNEEMRHEIVQRRQSGLSMRAIADELGISRGAVARTLARVQAQRDEGSIVRARPLLPWRIALSLPDARFPRSEKQGGRDFASLPRLSHRFVARALAGPLDLLE